MTFATANGPPMRKLQSFSPWFLAIPLGICGCRSVHREMPCTEPVPTTAAAPTQPVQPPTPPGTQSENDTLSQIVQLTEGFDRAGEAYFSPDMKWIVFQAAPRGEQHYQMYL